MTEVWIRFANASVNKTESVATGLMNPEKSLVSLEKKDIANKSFLFLSTLIFIISVQSGSIYSDHQPHGSLTMDHPIYSAETIICYIAI